MIRTLRRTFVGTLGIAAATAGPALALGNNHCEPMNRVCCGRSASEAKYARTAD